MKSRKKSKRGKEYHYNTKKGRYNSLKMWKEINKEKRKFKRRSRIKRGEVNEKKTMMQNETKKKKEKERERERERARAEEKERESVR